MFKKIITKAFFSSGLRSATLTTVGNVVSTALGAIAIILISRFLTPSDFGIFSAIFSMMLMVSKFGDLGTNIAFQRTLAQPFLSLQIGKKNRLITAGLILKFALALICLLLGLVFVPLLTNWLHLPVITYVAMGWFAMLGIILYDYISVVAQSAGRFGLAVSGSALQSVVKIVAIILLLQISALTPLNLIALYGLAPIISAVTMAILLPIKLVKVVKSKLLTELRPIIALTKWTILATISASLADNIDVLMVKSFLSSEATGLYSAAFRIASFAAVASYSIGIVLNVRVAKYKTKEHLNSYIKKAHLLALFLLIGMLFVSYFSPLLIRLTAGESYISAVPALKLLLYSTGILMATTPYVALFYTLDAPSYFGTSGVLTAVLLIALDYLWLPEFGIDGAGWAKLVVRFVVLVFTLIYAYLAYKKKYGQK